MSSKPAHPIQPFCTDKQGILRFQVNEIVRFLLDSSPYDMNDIAGLTFSDQDRCQFAQLIGYSLSGYSDLSYVSDEEYERAACTVELYVDKKGEI